jgi:formate hydrogenlyase subunit 6/NADH:ubiquinone oxidoreductase subunit I
MRPAGRAIADIIMGLVSIFKGMWITLVNWTQGKITERYPWRPAPIQPAWRGDFILWWNPEAQRLKCTACLSCQRACPTEVISITGTGKGKTSRPIRFDMDLTKCLSCHLCVEACPFDAIDMQPKLVANSRTRKIGRDLRRLAQPPPPDQAEAWEFQTSGQPDPLAPEPEQASAAAGKGGSRTAPTADSAPEASA